MERREFLRLAGASAVSSLPFGILGGAQLSFSGKRVVIFGGGIAGLTAAHELIDRGFSVTLYEMKEQLGGKARSIGVPNTGAAMASSLPGEHGFRLFFAFYKHVFNIMRRIPYQGNPNGVLDNLHPIETLRFATDKGKDFRIPTKMSVAARGIEGFERFWKDVFSYNEIGIEHRELAFFLNRLSVILSSCEARRFSELEDISWSKFLGEHQKSGAFRDVFGSGVTTMVQAVRGNEACARTMGLTFYNVFSQVYKHPTGAIFALNGPTSEKWISPWRDFLESKGLKVVQPARLVGYENDGRKIKAAKVMDDHGDLLKVEADYFVSAVPLEVLGKIVGTDGLSLVDPMLGRIRNLKSEWMVGTQFFFDQDVRIPTHGVMCLTKSPWALAAVSQNHFWARDVGHYGSGNAKGILSIDVSEWNKPGILHGKPAIQCSPDEVRTEVWAQLMEHLDPETREQFLRARLLNWFIDPSLEFHKEGNVYSDALFVNTTSSWKNRPSSQTSFSNFFVAGDFTRTYSDLACMETACESGKRAANEILASEGGKREIGVFQPPEPLVFFPAKIQDLARFHLGLPNSLASTNGF